MQSCKNQKFKLWKYGYFCGYAKVKFFPKFERPQVTLNDLKWPQMSFNSRRKQQKTYLCFGTDYAHMIDVTESLIIGNENIDQNVQLE